MKFILIGAAVVVVLLLAVAVAVSLLFDPNEYRGEIAAFVEDETGRSFAIDGDLGLRVFPCCAVSIDDTRLGNPPGFDEPDFASVKSVRLGLELLPLLFEQRAVVDTITVDGLRANLIRRADGAANWEFETATMESSAEPESAETEADLSGLSVAGININDAAVEFLDQQAGTHVALESLTITTGQVRAGEAVDLDVEMQVRDFDSEATVAAELDAGLLFAEDAARVDLTDVVGTVKLAAPDLPEDGAMVELQRGDIRADLNTGAAQLENIAASLIAAGVQIDVEAGGEFAGEGFTLSGKVSVPEFSPRDALAKLGEPPIETSDPSVLGAVEASADWALTEKRIDISALNLRLDDSNVTGKLGSNYAQQAATTFDVDLDAIDLDRYMSPTEEDAGGASGAEADDTDIPVDALRALDIDGRAAIGQLTAGGLSMQNVVANIKARDGVVRIDPSSADVYGGRYAGKLTIDVTGDIPRVTFAQTLDAVQAGGLMNDLYDAKNLEGLMQARLDGAGSGRTTNELIRGLAGSISLDLDDAIYKGADVWYEIRKSVARLKGKPAPEAPADPQTEITELGFSGNFGDGIMRSERLLAEIPFIRIDGGGALDMLENQLDFRLRARMLSRPDFPDADDLADLEKVTIPITVTGAADDPKIGIDLQELAKDAAVQKVQDRLLKKLGLDEPEDDAGDAPAEDGSNATEPATEEEKPRDALKKGLRDLLGG
ncbi:MAG: AsmA family protein [Gammaproteobacteria bacterium]